MNPTILIIDDEPRLRELYARLLSLEGYQIKTAGTVHEGETFLNKYFFDVVITDVKLPDGNGLVLTEKLKKRFPFTEIIVVTAYGTIADGVKAMKFGAYDYLTKGDSDDQILGTVAGAIEKSQKNQVNRTEESNSKTKIVFGDFIGDSQAIRRIINQAEKVAATEAAVLLTGETGTGKEWFAQAIRQASLRKDKPFVAINCAAIPATMLESELFGYKKGAFTGAEKDKTGLFEAANGGTLFLDEIGEMNLDLQSKILRALDSGVFNKLGEIKPIQTNVRILSATNRNLKNEIENGHFRADLYYRLATFTLALPPLRERIEDIPALAAHFLTLFSHKTGKSAKQFTAETLEKLKSYHWPGNIRELRNVVERAVILTETPAIEPDCLPYEVLLQTQNEESKSADWKLETIEKEQICKALAFTKGNKTQTALLLGIGVATLYRKLETYRLA